MVMQACNASTQGAEAKDFKVEAYSGYTENLSFKKKKKVLFLI